MTWARLDDRTRTEPGWVKLADAAARHVAEEMRRAGDDPGGRAFAELTERARKATMLAKSVHLFTLMYSVPALTDGKITPADITEVCSIGSLTREEWLLGADLLVTTGAWRLVRASKRDPLGGYQMILGWAAGEQPLRVDEQARKKRQALRDALRQGRKDYPNRVAAEKRAAGQCEYCDRDVGSGGEIDHVDPNLFSNDLANLAICCRGCNTKKGGQHSLEAVGMSFTPRALAARATFGQVSP